MAFGSGSSFATDRWMRRGGLPSSAQAFSVGSAKRLHQHSSQKPTAHSGSAPATSISRSLAKLAFFSFVQGVCRGDPPLRPHPPHTKEAQQGGPDGLPGDTLRGESLLEGDIGDHLQSPKARLAPELPRRAVEHLPECLGALLVEGGVYPIWARRARGEGVPRPLSLKARMAFLTVCEAHPRLRAIFGGDSPRALARRIWDRRITKASLERSPASRRSRSFFDSSRTKIGGFMPNTIAHNTLPSLRMH